MSRRTTPLQAINCSNNILSQKLKLIKKLTSFNDFRKYIVHSIFHKTLQAHQDKSERNLKEKEKEPVVIYFRLPYYGAEEFQLLKSCIRKNKVNCKNDNPVVFKILYDVPKIALTKTELLLSIIFCCVQLHVSSLWYKL